MKLKKQTINLLLLSTLTLAITACGGGGSNSSSDCNPKLVDSDGDGFYDAIDIAPNDASIPGDFSTPEKILSNPEVKKVLKIAKENGVNIRTELGNNPPNLTGYYRMESGGDAVVAATPTDGIYSYHLNNYFGAESRVCSTKERYEFLGSSFSTGGSKKGTYSIKNAMLRGDKNYYTYYRPYKSSCGGDVSYKIHISSAKLDLNGNIVDEKFMTVKVYGKMTRDCRNNWVAGYLENSNKVTDLDELEYMCVDGDKAYVPSETWTNSDKESCRCTADVEIECS